MRVTLDRELLPVESDGGYALTYGTSPAKRDLVMPNALAEKLFSGAKRDGSKLVIYAPELKKKVAISKLSIIGTSPADNPNESALTLVDRRHWWRYKHIRRTFNVPRRSGDVRRIGTAAAVGKQPLVDDVVYAAWSLKDGRTRWSTREIVEEVMNAVAGPGMWRFDRSFGSAKIKDPIEDLRLDDSGDAAIARVLGELGGAVGIYMDRGGIAVLYNRLSEEERLVVGAPPAGITTRTSTPKPALVGEGYWAVQDRRLERPRLVRVLFDRLVELRVDYETVLGQSTYDPVAPPPRLVDVLPSPEDFTQAGREVLVGQWIELDFYLAYLVGKQPAGLPALSRTIINDGWLCNVLESYADPALDPSGLWGRRIDAIRQHYRLSYQLNKPWRDRLTLLEPYRVAIEDFQTGSRALSPAFLDYAVFESWRSRGTTIAARPAVEDVVRNRYSNPSAPTGGNIVGVDYTTLRDAAAAQVSVEDLENGIIRFNFGAGNDASQRVTNYVRSALHNPTIPSNNLRRRNAWLQDGRLVQNHEVSTILAAAFGSPADGRAFHAEEVTISEAAAALPLARTPEGEGPVMEIRIPASLAVARFPWADGRAAQFYDLFAPTSGGASLPAPSVAKVLGDPSNKRLIREVAIAAAARVYAHYHDGVEGRLGTGLDPSFTIRGRIASVEFVGDATKGAIARIAMPPEPEQISLQSILPRSVRRVTEGLVDPRPGA